jgi:DNA-binding winged helix-turn-helix (wHTH) protein
MLLEDEKPVHLGSRALDVLVALVQSAGDTLHKDQPIACAQPDTVVDEGALRVNVAALRRALGDGRGGNRFIANIPGRGYSFVAPVRHQQGQETAALPKRSAPGGNLPAQLTRVAAVVRPGERVSLTPESRPSSKPNQSSLQCQDPTFANLCADQRSRSRAGRSTNSWRT